MQGKRRKVTLSKYEVDSNNIARINKDKQVNSFLPNFIHSMDASNIVLLVNKAKDFDFDIVTIHDCFGVHANHTEILSYLVKEAFISIYGNKDCIDKFHSLIIHNIKSVYSVKDGSVIDLKGNTLKIPEKPFIGDIDLKTQLLESKYFIN